MHWPFHAEVSDEFKQTGQKIEGETHSSYHEFLFKLGKINERLYTTTARHLAEGRQKFLNEFFEQLDGEARGEI